MHCTVSMAIGRYNTYLQLTHLRSIMHQEAIYAICVKLCARISNLKHLNIVFKHTSPSYFINLWFVMSGRRLKLHLNITRKLEHTLKNAVIKYSLQAFFSHGMKTKMTKVISPFFVIVVIKCERYRTE